MRDDTKEMILIVDDTLASINVVETALTEAGYRVSVATTWEKVTDLILPDFLIIIIYRFGICRRLKEKKSAQSIPIIFRSVFTETFDKVKGFDPGATDYLIIHITPEEFLTTGKTHPGLRDGKQVNLQRTLGGEIK